MFFSDMFYLLSPPSPGNNIGPLALIMYICLHVIARIGYNLLDKRNKNNN